MDSTTIDVTYSTYSRATNFKNFAPNLGSLSLNFDATLGYITDLSTYQETDVQAIITFSDGSNNFDMDVSSFLNLTVEGSAAFAIDGNNHITTTGVDTATVKARNSGTSAELASSPITSTSTAVSITQLLVLMPSEMSTSLSSSSITSGTIEQEVTTQIDAKLDAEGETLQTYVYAELADGNLHQLNPTDVTLSSNNTTAAQIG